MAVQHGKRTTYVRGCRCDPCKEANRLYQIDLKNRKRTGGNVVTPLRSLAAVPDDPPPPPQSSGEPEEMGRVEKKVDEEIKSLSSGVKHPGLVESALAMARILDNDALFTTHPSAQRQLMVALEKLHSASTRRKGNLATVAQMSNRGDQSAEKAAAQS